MFMNFCLIFLVFWETLKTYTYGFYCLLVQLTQKHVQPEGIPSQPGKVAIVTGGASGIGFEISRKLAAKQVHVIIAGPNSKENEKAVAQISSFISDAKVEGLELQLMSFRSVDKFVEKFLSKNLPLHILVNNAGVMFTPYMITEDGLERQTQVNYYSHFYLIQRLLGKLQESGADNCWSRIINVTSCMHFNGTIDFSSFGKRVSETWYGHSPHATYCDSKLAVVLATYQLNKQLRTDNSRVSVNVVHPGIVKSGLTRHLNWMVGLLLKIVILVCYKDASQGADVSLYAALSPTVEGHSGRYYDNCTEVKSSYLSYCRNLQEELWEKTLQIVHQKKQN